MCVCAACVREGIVCMVCVWVGCSRYTTPLSNSFGAEEIQKATNCFTTVSSDNCMF